jgi:hypothetical protein
MDNETYLLAYAEGYAAAMSKIREREANPVLDAEDLVRRYGGKISKAKAQDCIRAIRHVCNGGMLGSSSYVMLSEVLYWESKVDKTYIDRL